MPDTLEYVVRLRGGPEAASEASKVREAITGVGGSMKKVNEEGSRSSGLTSFSGGLRKVATGLIAVGAGYKAWEGAKGALEFTHELALGTNKLATATGMSVEESSHWVAAAQAMGVPANALGMTFTRLSAAAEKQVNSNGKQVTAFDKLGISSQFVNEHIHDMPGLLDEVVGRFHNLQGGPEKTALEMEVFGRGWQTLNPLLREGAKGLDDVLGMAAKFGVTLHGNTGAQLEELRKAEMESTFAGDGLRLAFAELAEGPLVELLHGFSSLANAARTGDWVAFDKDAAHLGETLSKIIENVMPHVAETFGHLAPALLSALWHGFETANLGGELVIGGLIAHKLGLDSMAFGLAGRGAMFLFLGGVRGSWRLVSAAGGVMGGWFVGGFETATLAGMYAWDAIKVFAGPGVVAAMGTAGTIAGTAFQVAFLAGAAFIGFELGKKLGEWVANLHFHMDFSKLLTGNSPLTVTEGSDAENASHHLSQVMKGERHASRAELKSLHSRLTHTGPAQVVSSLPKAAFGASVISPGLLEVGERGPEILNLPGGASVNPLAPGSLAGSGGDIVLQVDGRELFRIVRRQEGLAVAQGEAD